MFLDDIEDRFWNTSFLIGHGVNSCEAEAWESIQFKTTVDQ